MITLYQFPYSQHSRRVVSLLEEAGIEYNNQTVNMMEGEHMSPAFLEINPNHQVPTLVDEDVKIHESNAILRYLCEKYELTNWYPKGLAERANVEQWLDWIQCQMSPSVVAIVFNTMFAGDKADQKAISDGQEKLLELSLILENALEGKAFLGGEVSTIADLALASNIFHLGLVKQIPESQNIQAWYQRISALEGFKKSLPEM